MEQLLNFLHQGFNRGGFNNDDVVGIMLPLLRQVAKIHDEGFVAPLHNLESIEVIEETFFIREEDKLQPVINLNVLKQFQSKSGVVEITQTETLVKEIGENQNRILSEDQSLNTNANEIKSPAYLLNYLSYEMQLGHHSALSDVFVLGLLMASLAYNLDLTQEQDVRDFIEARNQPTKHNRNLHPVIANLVWHMTHLDPKKRGSDLHQMADRLEHYKDLNTEWTEDLAEIAPKNQSRNKIILSKLKSRLFDLTRRNRLLYFKKNTKHLNLTVASVPMVLNIRYIFEHHLITFKRIEEKIKTSGKINLSSLLQAKYQTYINPRLNKIRLEARRDINEYGFSQLKLTPVFLHWFNFKENNEVISSPLLLLSVKLTKRKGLKDQYMLEFNDSIAEVNPVLAYQLKELYNIELPERVDLFNTSIHEFYEQIKKQIAEYSEHSVALNLIEKPRIKIIHAEARKLVNQFSKRKKHHHRFQHYENIDYSYSERNFKPLGLELFKTYVKPYRTELELFIDDDVQLSNGQLAEQNRTLYQMEDNTQNAYVWEMDLCHVILGNFNYKKMSLVRDYNEIIATQKESTVYDELFSAEPKDYKPIEVDQIDYAERYPIINSDPTQTKAVTFARSGKSYLIQGPPGTGKSQTIANLVADFVARGKKVLFVCEKRAALDVVYYRLKQKNLEQLCCLIHDSQADKKEFIQDLKACYESFIQEPIDGKKIEETRQNVLQSIQNEIHAIELYHRLLGDADQEKQLNLRQLLDRLFLVKESIPSEAKNNWEDIPNYSEWQQLGDAINTLFEKLEAQGFQTLNQHVFRHFKQDLFKHNSPVQEVKAKLERALSLAEEVNERWSMLQAPIDTNSIEQIREFTANMDELTPLANQNVLAVLSSSSAEYLTLYRDHEAIEDLTVKHQATQEQNRNWKQKLTPVDARNALEIMNRKEGSFFAFFSKSYRQTKKLVQASYNFSAHQVKMKQKQVLKQLVTEYDLLDEINTKEEGIQRKFSLPRTELLEICNHWQRSKPELASWLAERAKFSEIEQFASVFDELILLIDELIAYQSAKTVDEIEEILATLIDQFRDYSYYLPYLQRIDSQDSQLSQLLRDKDWNSETIQAALLQSSISDYLNANRELESLRGSILQAHTEKISVLINQYFDVNALFVLAKQSERFNQLIRLSELSISGLSDQEKAEKKNMTEARKVLENEFGKSIRFKSIRDLASNEAGDLIRELKPVWLMSPLSVSDTLPMDHDYFDVVIFDEASQITLEEGIPPLFRANQAIIVGDQMQMPPTNFFSKSIENDEDEDFLAVEVDSLLDQGDRKLPEIMLGWHYRSRNEALISFSNAAFYRRELLTIPDEIDRKKTLHPILVTQAQDAKTNFAEITNRSISYHYVENGIYENRSNEYEAEYIAYLVAEFLERQSPLSIGVVAFSQQQQKEIEDTLQEVFAELDRTEELEQAFLREKDGEFVGLFVKNLENVQGDERDVIIMSTCYGYNPRGKMLMNFGPINKQGGEKRLNVIFSRAKKHMVVVSSIKHTDITNEYNEGANHFKKYLQFAELTSIGEEDKALQVLNTLSLLREDDEERRSALVEGLAIALKNKGYFVETYLGQSEFKCHLAIKKTEEQEQFDLGILIDDDAHYENDDVVNQYAMKPAILEAFGWKILTVFALDVYDNEDYVLEQIIHVLEGKQTEENEAENELPEIKVGQFILEKNDAICLEKEFSSGIKFWEIGQVGCDLEIRYGRVGKDGQKLIKNYDTEAEARKEMQKLIEQKETDGYREV